MIEGVTNRVRAELLTSADTQKSFVMRSETMVTSEASHCSNRPVLHDGI